MCALQGLAHDKCLRSVHRMSTLMKGRKNICVNTESCERKPLIKGEIVFPLGLFTRIINDKSEKGRKQERQSKIIFIC